VVKQSLSLQWLSKQEAPQILGKLIAVSSVTSLLIYSVLWLCLEWLHLDYDWNFLLGGGVCMFIAFAMWLCFPHYQAKTMQHKKIILRKRYWLYYLLTFLSGARRQIFMVFAAFLMVEKFGYQASEVTLLFLINYTFNWLFAERIGKFIHRFGERNALSAEYIGLIFVFVGYGLVDNATVGALLYILDHMFFAMAIAISTYFQKIAAPEDISASAGVSFTISHIAAVVIPVLLGLVWIQQPSLVFYIGALFAIFSLVAAQYIPRSPSQGNETAITNRIKQFQGGGSIT
jgi:predicted MFS family arabinose efflux permease